MSESSKKLLQAAAGAAGGEALAIEDVFSTYLYTGNGSPQTITNGIDLAGEGGLVWSKNRQYTLGDFRQNVLIDTLRGGSNYLLSNSAQAEASMPSYTRISAFNNDGFDTVQSPDENYATWTFRKAPRFFDVVTYTGNGNGSTSQTLSHSLGSVPGFIIVKTRSVSTDWACYHASLGVDKHLKLNTTGAAVTQGGFFPSTPTSSTFTVGQDYRTNWTGVEYVAYLFAHDPLGPSGDGSDGMIACGSFTTDGSGNFSVNLGWEPQWVMIKSTDFLDSWYLIDVMRGMSNTTTNVLRPNTSGSESAYPQGYCTPTANGFTAVTTDLFTGSKNFIYIAIRRGPMRAPESGTEVFAPVFGDATPPAFNTGFPVDLGIYKSRLNPFGIAWNDRLRGEKILQSNTTAAESGNSMAQFDYMDGWGDSTAFTDEYIGWNFRRAPGFFDVVAYTSQGTSFTINHNLKAVPELMIFKNRDSATFNWVVWSNTNNYLRLNTSDARYMPDPWGGTLSSTQISIPAHSGTADSINPFSVNKHIAYLFATLPGVSKVGSYTGNGSSQTIDCGFTSGARFVLIKSTNITGDWNVYDTARGIVAGNDPYLAMNTTAAENTSWDLVDPASSGFVVNNNNNAPAVGEVNALNVNYIFLAIA